MSQEYPYELASKIGEARRLSQAAVDILNEVAQQMNPRPEVQVDISKIDWKDKEGSPSPPSLNCWAWAFAYNQDGTLKTEAKQLIEGINQHGKVTVGSYEITLARDKFLNRKPI